MTGALPWERPEMANPDDPLASLAALTPDAAQDGQLEPALRTLAARVAGLDPIRREVLRLEAVRLLKDLGVSGPARLVDAAMPPEPRQAPEGKGRPLGLQDPEPWADPVDGAALLEDLVETVRRFLALPEGGAELMALWVAFAHCHDAFHVSALLVFASPEKRCGKTTALTLVSALVPRPLHASSLTAAVVFRGIEQYSPTLLVDEADTFLRDNEELRGVLNSGHNRASAHVLRCEGDEHQTVLFSTWAPKAVALIGNLPPTLEDRSLVVPMRRRAPGEDVERLRLDRLAELEPLRQRLARWAADNLAELGAADPAVPEEVQSDRARDNWRPLLSVADAAGGRWPERAREVAVLLSGGAPSSESLGVLLLGDLRTLFDSRGFDRLTSEAVVSALREIEERPWPEFRDGHAITARQVARLLRPFSIAPRQTKTPDGRNHRAYHRADCLDAFSRYLGPLPVLPHSHATGYAPGDPLPFGDSVADGADPNTNAVNEVAEVADSEPPYQPPPEPF
ncbi:MAG TPA: DUF3631 domain-containing protein [Thermoanaerobaculaceae bacterium]|nr:DUF3631 domain-containing protein [Thermoanaerobaculaceae bacterium]